MYTLYFILYTLGEFVDADGPSALLDVIAETSLKPRMSWLDVEARRSALLRTSANRASALGLPGFGSLELDQAVGHQSGTRRSAAAIGEAALG